MKSIKEILLITFLLYPLHIYGQDLPLIIYDESRSNWFVDCFAGNGTTGNEFYQGPKLEIGGLTTPGIPVVDPNGVAYLTGGTGLSEISTDGIIRQIMPINGLVEGPMEECMAGLPIWSIKDSALFLTGPNCLRKVVHREDGTSWVEVVAGIPFTDGSVDGPAKSSTFPLRCMGITCDSQGVFYWLQVDRLRRIKNDTVTTLTLTFVDPPTSFNFAMGENRLSKGENNNTLYIGDFFNFRLLRYTINNGELRHVCGLIRSEDPYNRFGKNADGPALTYASANSGLFGIYDPFHNNVWVGGPDETRFRWLRLSDNYVKTVIGPGNSSWNVAGTAIPASSVELKWNNVSGFDDRGGVYISGNPKHSVYRAYNITEVRP